MIARAMVVSLALAACPVASAQEDAPPSTAPADKRVDLDTQRFYTDAQLEVALRALADAYPEFLRLESLGRSAEGRELWMVTVAARDGEDPSKKSAVLVVGARGYEDQHGVEMALFTLFDLMQNHTRDAAVARALQGTTLYVMPCLDPDRRAALLEGSLSQQEGSARIDANFPAAWDPWIGSAAGPYPLALPESAALARFLASHTNLAAVQVYASGLAHRDPERGAGERNDESLRAFVRGLDDAGKFACAFDLDLAPGSLLAHATRELGLLGFVSELGGAAGRGLPAAGELLELSRRASKHTVALLSALPSLGVGEPGIERLQDDLWQVDLALHNHGGLPTQAAASAQRRAAPAPRLTLSGARLVAAAVRGSDGVYRPLARAESPLLLADIDAQGELGLRLVLSAPPDAAIELQLAAPRAGSAGRVFALR